MLRYEKGAEPTELSTMRSTPGATWASVGAETRGPVREALRRDQGGLCAYCEQHLPEQLGIEHWHARADGGPDFAWSNLLGVCDGNRGRGELHCDAARGDVPLFLHPVQGRVPDPRPLLRWTGDGRVFSDHPQARRDIETLVLNHRSLIRQRVAALDALRDRGPQGNRRVDPLPPRAGAARCQVAGVPGDPPLLADPTPLPPRGLMGVRGVGRPGGG